MRYIMLAIVAVIISTSAAYGSMITFTQTGRAAGYFLDVEYYNRPYTFTAVGDLSTVHNGGWVGHEYAGYQVDLLYASITVNGLGTVTLPHNYYSFTVSPSHPNHLVMNVTGPDPWTEMILTSQLFAGWDMTTSTSIDDVRLETFNGLEFPKANSYPNQYVWDFREVANFSATVTPVPEPSSMMLLAAGFLALSLFGKQGRRLNMRWLKRWLGFAKSISYS